MNPRDIRCLSWIVLLVCGGTWPGLYSVARAQDAEGSSAGEELSIEQARLADRYERLEMVAERLAELSAATDPNRARRLREAIARSRDQDVGIRFEAIVDLLENERLAAASRNQQQVHGELSALLELLLKDSRDSQIESEQKRIRRYLGEVNRLIRWQKGIHARTQGGDDRQTLGRDQRHVTDETDQLGQEIESSEAQQGESDQSSESASENDSENQSESSQGDQDEPGESSSDGEPSQSEPGEQEPSPGQDGQESQPGQGGQSQPGGDSPQQQPEPRPAQKAGSQIRAAAERMQRAQEKLDQAKRDGAASEQQQAVDELEQARAELERVLRQLREEEMERTLTLLAARFRKMLDAQLQVNEATVVLAKATADQRGHREEIEAARLSREEEKIIREIEKALLLLREEGSSVAFPEVVEQTRDDMRQVAERLADLHVGELTQSIERDIVESLEETIAALDQAISQLDEQQNNPPPGQMAGQPTEPPLVNKIAELRMIRSLQNRIYRRTARYGEMVDGEQADTGELLAALDELAQRQERVYQAARDLVVGRND